MKNLTFVNFRFVFRNAFRFVIWQLYELIQILLVKLIKAKSNLVIIMIPGHNLPGGGVLSLYSLYKESCSILSEDNHNIFLCNINGTGNEIRQSWFKNNYYVVNERSLKYKIEFAKKIIIHLPEMYTELFLISHPIFASYKEKVIINIYNQNNLLMPPVHVVNKLKSIYREIVLSVNFSVDLKSETSQKYGLPLHSLPSWLIDSKYEVVDYSKKHNTIIISPDQHPAKGKILDLIESNFPQLKIIEVKRMDFFKFQQIQKFSKWAISFGEGFDGYYVGAHLFGGVCFSVYNTDFFPCKFSNKLSDYLYGSYEDMFNNIIADIKYLDCLPALYDRSSELVRRELEIEFSHNLHVNGITKFYDKEYTINYE